MKTRLQLSSPPRHLMLKSASAYLASACRSAEDPTMAATVIVAGVTAEVRHMEATNMLPPIMAGMAHITTRNRWLCNAASIVITTSR